MAQFLEKEEQKPKTEIAFQKGNDLVTGRAWNAWVTDDKDITMIGEKGTDPLQKGDPWAQAIPESDEDKQDQVEGLRAASNDSAKVRTPRIKRHSYVQRPEEAYEGCLRKQPETQETTRAEEIVDEDPNSLRAILKSMSLHTINDSVKGIHKGLGALEAWVQTLIDGIEDRVTNAFANQQDMIDKVEDRVEDVEDSIEEMQKTNKKKFEAIGKTIGEHSEDIRKLKKAIEDMREEGESGRIQQSRQGGRPTQRGDTAQFQKNAEDRRVESIRISERIKDHHRRSDRAAEEDIVTLH